MLTDEQIEAIHRYSVEKEKERTTDAELWAKLLALWEDELKLIPEVHRAYNIMQAGEKDSDDWQCIWKWLIKKAKLDRELFDLVAWHLVMRGDPEIGAWLNSCDEYRHFKNKECVSLGWRPSDQRQRELPSLRLVYSRSTSDA